jgi:outer membrane protein OmpA-like peptidoglycan-associated protein
MEPPRESEGPNFLAPALGAGLGIVLLGFLLFRVGSVVDDAGERLASPDAAKPQVAVADHAEASYCTPQFKEVLERVLHSCGLVGGAERRGCKPADVKSFASISDEDFNALFHPLEKRGGMVLYDTGKHELDDEAMKLVEERWSDRRGARYFLVVGRASTTGTATKNRALSHRRANSVLFHVKELAKDDPDVDRMVGLLWLGSEFAQLNPKEFCEWKHSRSEEKCDEQAINQSAFASWVDCRL